MTLYLKAICYAIIHRVYDVMNYFDERLLRFHDWAEDIVAFHEGGNDARTALRETRAKEMMALLEAEEDEQTDISDGEVQGAASAQRPGQV